MDFGLKNYTNVISAFLIVIDFAFHALTLDENRALYAPALLYRAVGDSMVLKQVWFKGGHTDLGFEDEQGACGKFANAWMLEMLEKYLDLHLDHDEVLCRILQNDTAVARTSATAVESASASIGVDNGDDNNNNRIANLINVTATRGNTFGRSILHGLRDRIPGSYSREGFATEEFIHETVSLIAGSDQTSCGNVSRVEPLGPLTQRLIKNGLELE